MADSKWTPGPWMATDNFGHAFLIRRREVEYQDQIIAIINEKNIPAFRENADLIARAPETAAENAELKKDIACWASRLRTITDANTRLAKEVGLVVDEREQLKKELAMFQDGT